MAESYYTLLGVRPGATEPEIKAAYRRKAKALHPDACGGDRELFQAVQEAYEVLSDPARRRAYDLQLADRHPPRARPPWRLRAAPARSRAEPLRSSPHPVEPLLPQEPPFPRDWPLRSPWDILAPDLLSPVGGDWADQVEQIYVEVSLTSEQATRGGRVNVRVPVQVTCPACRGWGGRGPYVCPHCAGRGRIPDERPLALSFPGGIVEGDVTRISLDRVGIPGIVLTVRFTVERW
jgi:curved DNA-binding protein CbpA